MTDLSAYLAVLIAAATPWIEILFVIPIGIAAGLNPAAVATVAFVGNTVPVIGIVLAGERLTRWWDRRRDTRTEPSRRAQRARRLLKRYGIPGLALLGPLVTGAHLAAFIAAGLRPNRTRVIGWMSASLAVWSAALTLFTVQGVAVLT